MKGYFSQKRVWFNVVVVIGVLLGILLVSAPIAVTAQGPNVITGICPFGVQVDELFNKLKVKETRGGVFIATGALKLRLTNVDSGATLELNIPGPGRIIPNATGTTEFYMGPWLLGIPEGVLPEFTPRLFLSKGRVIAELNTDSPPTFTSLTIQGGKVIDLCAKLAE